MASEEVNPANLLDRLEDPEENIGIRKNMAEKIGTLPIDKLKPILAGLPPILDNFLEETENTENIELLGQVLLSLGKLCFTYPEKEEVKDLLKQNVEGIPIEQSELTKAALRALEKAVNSYPTLALDFKDRIVDILSLKDQIELKKLGLEVITRASWISPSTFSDFLPKVKQLLDEGDPNLVEITLQTIYKISRKNYYVVESIIKDLIPENAEEADPKTVFLLSRLEIPPEEIEFIGRIYDLNEDFLMEGKEPEIRINAAYALAKLVRHRELSSLQEKFAKDLRLKIEEALNEHEKAELISTASIPEWSDLTVLDTLMSFLIDILTSSAEAKEVQIQAAETLKSNLLSNHEFSEEVVNAFAEVLNTGWEEDIKLKIIDLLTSTPFLEEAETKQMIKSLIDLVDREEEGILARITASDSLADLASQFPSLFQGHGNELLEIYHSSTITDLKRSLVEVTGTVLKSLDVSGKNPFLKILVEALDNRDLYSLSLENLVTIAYSSPKALVPYTDTLFKFRELIKEVEAESEIGRFEEISYIERPKRLFLRIISKIINVHPEATKKAVSLFLAFLRGSETENLTKEAAYALSTAYKLKPEVVQTAIANTEISNSKLNTIRGLMGEF